MKLTNKIGGTLMMEDTCRPSPLDAYRYRGYDHGFQRGDEIRIGSANSDINPIMPRARKQFRRINSISLDDSTQFVVSGIDAYGQPTSEVIDVPLASLEPDVSSRRPGRVIKVPPSYLEIMNRALEHVGG